MAIFPAYLATSFINKFCSPPANRYSPFSDNRSPAQQDGLVDANKKNALHSGLPAHIPRLLVLFFLLGFSHQIGAQQHTPAAEKEGRTEKGWGLKERDGEKERKGILGVMKKRAILTEKP